MILRTYIQYIYADISPDVATRHEYSSFTINKIKVPKYVEEVRFSCRLEEDILYLGQKITLTSNDISAYRVDFRGLNKEFPNHNKESIYAKEIIKHAKEINFHYNVKELDKEPFPEHYVSYSSHFHPDFYGTSYGIKSRDLKDIRIPKDCMRFDTYDRLVKRVVIGDRMYTLLSPKFNIEKYIIGDRIPAPNWSNGVDFVRSKNGSTFTVFREENVISPKQIDDNGAITVKF